MFTICTATQLVFPFGAKTRHLQCFSYQVIKFLVEKWREECAKNFNVKYKPLIETENRWWAKCEHQWTLKTGETWKKDDKLYILIKSRMQRYKLALFFGI